MALKFFNTLTKQVEPFREIDPGRVGLYTCGPTVYDYPHIGNFRSYVFEDVVKRFLLYRNYKVRHVMNITDIDDKTIRKANERNVTLAEVTGPYIEAFFKDIATLNILPADEYPRATGHIPEMVQLIQDLLDKGVAYRKGDSIYFSIAGFPAYGRLANIERENLKPGTRVDLDEYEKNNVQDFVLWKGRKPGEHFWPTPLGEGRPGWHIECSAMSSKYLGTHFDIHMGGVDNIFPHHENEIAQSEAASGGTFVNYWLHCQHLVVNNQKMSKSLGNFYLLGDVLQRGYDPLVIRWLLLSTHYRKLLNFTWENLEMAKSAMERINNFLFALRQPGPGCSGPTPWLDELIAANELAFASAMDDDFNISGSLGIFFDFIHAVNPRLDGLDAAARGRVLAYAGRLNGVLGVLRPPSSELLDAEIMALIEQRQQARREKNFTLADAIRRELQEKGIVLMDTPDGVQWKRCL